MGDREIVIEVGVREGLCESRGDFSMYVLVS